MDFSIRLLFFLFSYKHGFISALYYPNLTLSLPGADWLLNVTPLGNV